ncbi:uncharacterized protein LOC131332345 isoform X3 [Rhododendron vialii]|uniref:uncharacterized protein LOC131332345 isoform X3 n=1 Tax=Rhododendron vialii TaxID=182163 RepID=UPI00265F190F|nr:uncharacterized protein LOC131332345 isoform X3 [Rhododendron vialii]
METLERDTGDSKEASSSAEIQNSWVEAQDSLKTRLVTEDDFRWQLPTTTAAATTLVGGGGECEVLKYVGGVDISFAKDDPSVACGTLVVLDLQTLEVVYEDYSAVTLHIPYVPGFLAFREVPILLQLLEKMKTCDHPFYPQMLMVDGNGILHPRGSQSYWKSLDPLLMLWVGLSSGCSGKSSNYWDRKELRQLLETKGTHDDILTLRGDSGRTWGAAMRSNPGSFKPIYISVGHRVSLATAVKIARMTSKYRVPEPIRLI